MTNGSRSLARVLQRKRTNRIEIEIYFKELAHMLVRAGKSQKSLGQAGSLEIQIRVDVTV